MREQNSYSEWVISALLLLTQTMKEEEYLAGVKSIQSAAVTTNSTTAEHTSTRQQACWEIYPTTGFTEIKNNLQVLIKRAL